MNRHSLASLFFPSFQTFHFFSDGHVILSPPGRVMHVAYQLYCGFLLY